MWDLGDFIYDIRNIPEAEKVYEQMAEASAVLFKKYHSSKNQRYLSVSYNKLGDICKEEGKLDDAKKYYEQGLEISKALAAETNTVRSYDDLAYSYYYLGVLNSDKNLLTEAYNIWSKLSKQCPNVARYAELRDFIKQML